MPGPVVTPTSTPPEPAAPAPQKLDEPVADVAPPAQVAAVNLGTNDGQTIAMPAVAYTLPPVQGQKVTDRGEKAQFVVLHTRFGRFVKGSRIAESDLSESADVAGLIALGAIAELPKPEKPAKAGK